MDVSVAPRPVVPVSVAARPAVTVSVGPRPRAGVTVAPAGSVPPQPKKALRFDAPIELGVNVVVRQVPIIAMPAAATLVPDVTAVVKPEGGTYIMTADATLAVTVTPAVVPAVSAAAETVVDAAAATHPTITAAAEVTPDITASQIVVVTDMGMDKSGQQTATTGKITGWAPRASSNIVNNELVANGSGTKTVRAQVRHGGGGFPQTDSVFDVMLNDTVLLSATAAFGSTHSFAPTSVALTSGDRVWMRKSSGNSRTVETATFIYWD